jgi:hypothetical protein
VAVHFIDEVADEIIKGDICMIIMIWGVFPIQGSFAHERMYEIIPGRGQGC